MYPGFLVAAALLQIVEFEQTGKYILGGKYFSIKALAEIYGKVNGMKGTRKTLPAGLMRIIAITSKALEPFVKKPMPLNT